ncbi:hypothetical protein FXO38_25704 [Capsicum annuum]|uniref:Uncharacterized protein n=1 Tax=Capsicum annuum TaxID=4072 RepID=A0A2G2YDX7_CAPAN|nr:hypothetical protein FXO38_25704 [Capsicum annuum]KAF3646899.1 hypothetical protein FXO37_20232 [Capsicum annuum]PHT67954.1 hypothetical protein T459_27441 [Capsicum annuum]
MNPTTLSVAITEAQMDSLKETPENDNQTPKVTSKAATIDNETKKSSKKLIENLSAALVNVSVKEDLVKQHAKVAEEAVDVGSNVQNDDQDGNTNEQTHNEQDVGSNMQNVDQDIGVAEQSADPDEKTNKQFLNEQDVDATEQNANQDENANEQSLDDHE